MRACTRSSTPQKPCSSDRRPPSASPSAACSGPLSSSTALATLGGGASGGGQGVVPLQLRVQAQQAELNDAKMRAQQSAGVAQARQREMEALQQQVAAAQLQAHTLQMEAVNARGRADEAAAEAAEAKRLQMAAREEVNAALMRAAAAEDALNTESGKLHVAHETVQQLQNELREAEGHVATAEAPHGALRRRRRDARYPYGRSSCIVRKGSYASCRISIATRIRR